MTSFINAEPLGDQPRLLGVDYGDSPGDKAVMVFGYMTPDGVLHITSIDEREQLEGVHHAST